MRWTIYDRWFEAFAVDKKHERELCVNLDNNLPKKSHLKAYESKIRYYFGIKTHRHGDPDSPLCMEQR